MTFLAAILDAFGEPALYYMALCVGLLCVWMVLVDLWERLKEVWR